MKYERISIGSGKTMVEFFSDEIVFNVYRSNQSVYDTLHGAIAIVGLIQGRLCNCCDLIYRELYEAEIKPDTSFSFSI